MIIYDTLYRPYMTGIGNMGPDHPNFTDDFIERCTEEIATQATLRAGQIVIAGSIIFRPD